VAYLLDTNVISELRKKNANANVLAWYDGVQPGQLYLSAVTAGEIRLAIERLRRRDVVQAETLAKWLGTLRATYRDRIKPVDEEVAEERGTSMFPTPCQSWMVSSPQPLRFTAGRWLPETSAM
jgi:predicted nucleic acid-binding protein